MKRIIIFAMLISLLILKIEAQTSIDQSYFSSNLPVYLWESGGSPYYIQTDIRIPWGSNLIISPGVEVIFEGHFKLEVKGSINAIGTKNERIIITSNDGKPWNGIRFDFSDGTDHSHSKLHYCNISNSKKNTTGYSDYEPQCAGGAIYIRAFSELEIVHCEIFGNEALEGQGGAIGIYDNSSPLIEYNSIHNNNAFKRGGAISIMNGCNAIIHNNKIYDNHSSKGGGAIAIGYLSPINGSASNPDIRWNFIYNNSTSGINGIYGEGGALFVCGSNPIISENNIGENDAFGVGGAIYLNSNSLITLESNNFENNHTLKEGGAIYCTSSSLNPMNNCQFIGNTAEKGAGIYLNTADLHATNCLFTQNTASADGGGIYINGSVSTIQNCNFISNTATGNGGGVFLRNPKEGYGIPLSNINLNIFKSNTAFQGSALYIDRFNNYTNNTFILNNLFAENHATNMATVYLQGNNNNTVFNHNTVANNTSGTYFWLMGICVDEEANFPNVNFPNNNFHNNIIYELWTDVVIIFDQNNNFLFQIPSNYYSVLVGLNYLNKDNNIPSNPNPNPGFISSSNYHLTSGSPCIDVGINLNSPYIKSVDLDGNQRIANTITDYGCYEYGSFPPSARKAKPGISGDASQVVVFPNPVSDFLTIILPTEENMEINIFTMSGQRVYYQEKTAVSNKYVIPMTNIQSGTYLLKLTNREQIITKRIVVQ